MKKYWIAVAIGAVVFGLVEYRHARTVQVVSNNLVVLRPQAQSDGGAAQAGVVAKDLNAGHPFLDTSVLKPPAGAKVAIYEFEDLECPACARAFPLVHAAAARYKIPLERHDYPWFFHIWSMDAAITARYIQDKISPQLADEFRGDVFAGQQQIASKDDLNRFTARWFQAHGQTMPFVMDAGGSCRLEVELDRALGDRIGVRSTPCIFVVTQNRWVAVPYSSIGELDRFIDAALAESGGKAATAS